MQAPWSTGAVLIVFILEKLFVNISVFDPCVLSLDRMRASSALSLGVRFFIPFNTCSILLVAI